MSRRLVAVAALAAVAALGACKREKQLAGVEQWNVKKTRLKHADGRCLPHDFPDGRKGTWCFAQQPISIAGMAVDIDLYFGGVEPETPLAELQLKVRICNEEKLLEWMRKGWGGPYETKGPTFRWKNEHMLIVGKLPDDPGSCLLRMFPHGEQAAADRAAGP